MVDLTTPQLDVEKIGSILEGRYGFSVKVLLNASDVEVMHAINDLNSELDEDDNLLIYYAGHGSQMEMGDLQAGYWLPVNADPPPRDTHWISNESITRHLGQVESQTRVGCRRLVLRRPPFRRSGLPFSQPVRKQQLFCRVHEIQTKP
jgi:hypothetical protein